jgi:malate dehydrogenase (oxaloacetate-decarboxylating)
VTLATLMAAVGVTKSKLSDQRIIIYGAGTAGMGVARQIRDAMISVDQLSVEDASKRFWLVDKFGLLTEALKEEGKVRSGLDDFIRPMVEGWNEVVTADDKHIRLLDVVKKVKPTVLIGTSTHAGAFTEDVIKEMSAHCERPIIFPLSNPSRLVEVHPKDANDWSKGKALLATGSPFHPVKYPNGKDYVYSFLIDLTSTRPLIVECLTHRIAECNNALIYPGLGLGASFPGLLCFSIVSAPMSCRGDHHTLPCPNRHYAYRWYPRPRLAQSRSPGSRPLASSRLPRCTSG